VAENPPEGIRNKVVTLRSLEPSRAGAFESALPTPQAKTDEERLLAARYELVKDRLRLETEEAGSNVMVTIPDRDVSLLQSELARRAEVERKLAAGGLEVKFGTGFGGGDWFGWVRSLFDWVGRDQARPIKRPSSTTPAVIPDSARIAMAGDWGTGLYGAPRIANEIKKIGNFDLLLHLGDVYYSGTKDEVQQRFLDIWPKSAGRISRALNSNHEMYSGGYAYFDLALPAFGQESSYFAFQNSKWLLIGLDTAYVDHDMDNEQVAWLKVVMSQAQGRKVALFSHQQLFSRLDNQGPKLESALRPMLEAKAFTAWYWGHEHQCVIYETHPRFELLGRCLGNGGIPEVRKREVKEAPTEKTVGNVFWKRMGATTESPSCLVLDGPNEFIENEEEKFAPHGFMTLELNGAALTERVFLANGREILVNQIS
jgi:hypothetical protein